MNTRIPSQFNFLGKDVYQHFPVHQEKFWASLQAISKFQKRSWKLSCGFCASIGEGTLMNGDAASCRCMYSAPQSIVGKIPKPVWQGACSQQRLPVKNNLQVNIEKANKPFCVWSFKVFSVQGKLFVLFQPFLGVSFLIELKVSHCLWKTQFPFLPSMFCSLTVNTCLSKDSSTVLTFCSIFSSG